MAGLFFIILTAYNSCKIDKHPFEDTSNGKIRIVFLESTLKSKIPSLKLSSFAKSINYIKLETNDQCLLSHPSIEDVDEGAIYINDNHLYLYKFNGNGKYIWKIKKVGKGPGEYLHITDVIIQPENDLLYILDNTQRKIIQYNLNGEFQKEIHLSVSTGSFSQIDDCFVLWNPPWGFVDQNNCYFLTFLTLNGVKIKTINREGNNNSFRGGLLTSADFYMLNKILYIKDTYHDTVFRISKNYTLEPHFIISQGKYKMTREMSENIWLREKYMNEYISQLVFWETDNLIIFSFFMEKYYLVIYDKQLSSFIHKSEGSLNKYAEIQNDLDNGTAFIPWFYKQTKLYGFFTPEEFKQNSSENPAISRMFSALNENSNPVVMIIELK